MAANSGASIDPSVPHPTETHGTDLPWNLSRSFSLWRESERSRAIATVTACWTAVPMSTCDAGASRLLVVQKWQSYGPREFLTSNGVGSMGYAVPGALAARLAHAGRSPPSSYGVPRRRSCASARWCSA